LRSPVVRCFRPTVGAIPGRKPLESIRVLPFGAGFERVRAGGTSAKAAPSAGATRRTARFDRIGGVFSRGTGMLSKLPHGGATGINAGGTP
jgi:hypothetical protein